MSSSIPTRGINSHIKKCISQSDVDLIIIDKITHLRGTSSSEDDVFQSLINDQSFINPSHSLVDNLLRRFRDDWKSAFAVFKWAASSHSHFRHSPQAYDLMVDILAKSKQHDKMNALLHEHNGLVTLSTIAKVMRRFSGSGKWEDAARIFDKLETFGLEKNTESMNLLLDTLCKEKKVDRAREIFTQLKSHIFPNAHTFNIFIHGWCKVNRVDEAHWTFQEMKGYGFTPCVVSYSIIVEFYCRQSKFGKVYELLDEMIVNRIQPNVITYTTIMHWMVRSGEIEEALQIPKRLINCKPDTLFYNCLIHALGKAGQLQEALQVFQVEMRNPNTSTYNSLIAMFCHHGEEQMAFNIFNQLSQDLVCKPDVLTYFPLLKLCFKKGKTDIFLENLLDDMVNKHNLSLDIGAYSLLIHGLCRANKCERAYLLFQEMINKELSPRYQTCRLLLDECNHKFMYDEAEKIENYIKKM